jgi:ABC-type Na+ transport system ATPase subunit NatA
VKYALDAVVVEGQFAVLHDDSNGLYYRMTNAESVK